MADDPVPADKDGSAQPGANRFERELTTDLSDRTTDPPRGLPLHSRILIGLGIGVLTGLGINLAVGGDNPTVAWVIANLTEPIGTLFLRGLLMIVVPLIGSSLIVGVAGIGDVRRLGRVGLKAFGYSLVISSISVLIGSCSRTASVPATACVRRRRSASRPVTGQRRRNAWNPRRRPPARRSRPSCRS